jgi:hypothetical protein
MSNTERRHKRVVQLRKRWRPNQKVKAQGREAAKRRAEVVEASMEALRGAGIITCPFTGATGSVE